MSEQAIDRGLVKRIDSLRKILDNGRKESAEAFCVRCGLNRTLFYKWDAGENVSGDSLIAIARAHPDVSLDWLVFGKVRDRTPYRLADRLASEIVEAANRTLELIPAPRPAKFVRLDEPDDIDP